LAIIIQIQIQVVVVISHIAQTKESYIIATGETAHAAAIL